MEFPKMKLSGIKYIYKIFSMTNILYENLYLANKQLNNNLAIGDNNLNSSNTYGTYLKNKAAVYQLVNLKNRQTYIPIRVREYCRPVS